MFSKFILLLIFSYVAVSVNDQVICSDNLIAAVKTNPYEASSSLVIIDPVTGQETNLFNNYPYFKGKIEHLSIKHPDLCWIIFSFAFDSQNYLQKNQYDLWAIKTDGSSLIRLTDTLESETSPEASVVNDAIFFSKDGYIHSFFWLDPDKKTAKTFFKGVAVETSKSSILIENDRKIYLYDIPTGYQTLVTDNGTRPKFCPDATCVYFQRGNYIYKVEGFSAVNMGILDVIEGIEIAALQKSLLINKSGQLYIDDLSDSEPIKRLVDDSFPMTKYYYYSSPDWAQAKANK